MTIILGRRHLYTHLVVGTETNREASGDASVSARAEFYCHGKSILAKL